VSASCARQRAAHGSAASILTQDAMAPTERLALESRSPSRGKRPRLQNHLQVGRVMVMHAMVPDTFCADPRLDPSGPNPSIVRSSRFAAPQSMGCSLPVSWRAAVSFRASLMPGQRLQPGFFAAQRLPQLFHHAELLIPRHLLDGWYVGTYAIHDLLPDHFSKRRRASSARSNATHVMHRAR